MKHVLRPPIPFSPDGNANEMDEVRAVILNHEISLELENIHNGEIKQKSLGFLLLVNTTSFGLP